MARCTQAPKESSHGRGCVRSFRNLTRVFGMIPGGICGYRGQAGPGSLSVSRPAVPGCHPILSRRAGNNLRADGSWFPRQHHRDPRAPHKPGASHSAPQRVTRMDERPARHSTADELSLAHSIHCVARQYATTRRGRRVDLRQQVNPPLRAIGKLRTEETHCELLKFARGDAAEMEFSLASHLIHLLPDGLSGGCEWSNGERTGKLSPMPPQCYSLQSGLGQSLRK
jgi:hypothetical protein